MDLIDYFIVDELSLTHTQFYSSQIHSSLLRFIHKIIQNLHLFQSTINNSFNKLYMKLQTYQSLYLCSKLGFNNMNQLNLVISLMKHQLIRCSISYQNILLIRYLLNANFKYSDITYKINPLNGQFIFKIGFIILDEYAHIIGTQLEQTIFQSIQDMKLVVIKQLKNILVYLESKYQIGQEESETMSNLFLKQTKKYINHSNQYAWKILRGKTENSKKQIKKLKYNNLKEEFINSNLYQITNPLINSINTVLNQPRQNIQSFSHLQYHQDDALKFNYLPKPIIRKQFKLLNEITVQKECFERQITNKQPKLETKEFGLANFSVKHQKSLAIVYSKEILNKLPPQQFIGLPKFYFIKNLTKQTENLLITNLYDSITFQQFLSQNNTVSSNLTKFYMINQIVLTIKYLRDHGIVFLNLRPDQVFIKKGFKLKLYGFKNSFHEEVLLRDFQFKITEYSPYQNIFPYVSVYKFGKNKSYDDERSDVYSLGVLIFDTLFRKCHWVIKDTTRLSMNIYQFYQKYETQPLLALQKLNDPAMLILKLITNLTLRSIKNKVSNDYIQQNESKKKMSMSERPYLDWMIIIIRHIMTYYEFII